MRKLIYSIGISIFLLMLFFTVSTSLTNPLYGMSEEATIKIEETLHLSRSDCDGVCTRDREYSCIIRDSAGSPIAKCDGWRRPAA